MADQANITLTGRLGKDPEAMGSSEKQVVKFSMAVNGYKKDQTSWFTCEVWGKLGDVVLKHCSKGKQVAVSGTMRIDNWTDKDGNNRQTPVVNVRELTFLGSADEAKPKQAPKKEIKADDIPF